MLGSARIVALALFGASSAACLLYDVSSVVSSERQIHIYFDSSALLLLYINSALGGSLYKGKGAGGRFNSHFAVEIALWLSAACAGFCADTLYWLQVGHDAVSCMFGRPIQ